MFFEGHIETMFNLFIVILVSTPALHRTQCGASVWRESTAYSTN